MIILHKNWKYEIKVHDFENGCDGDESAPPEPPSVDFTVWNVISDNGDYADILMKDDLEKKIIEKLTESEE